MSLLNIYLEIQSILTNFPVDAKEDMVSILEDLEDSSFRNVLGLYEPKFPDDKLASRIVDELVVKMNKLVKEFNIQMMQVISNAEKEYRRNLGKGR